jgi:TonB family protein
MRPGDPIAQTRTWTRRHWIICVTTAFAVQVLWLWLFSEKTPLKPRPTRELTRFWLLADEQAEARLSQRLKTQDPTLFALANPSGFSGGAWLKPRSLAFKGQEWIAPRQMPEPQPYLGPESSLAGLQTPPYQSQSVVTKPPPPETRMPAMAEPAGTESRLVFTGQIAQRSVLHPQPLPVWPGADAWQPTVIEVTVDSEGKTLSARLLSSSGLTAADQDALRIARQTRFASLPVSGPPRTKPTEPIQGRMIFQWATVPAASAPNDNKTK